MFFGANDLNQNLLDSHETVNAIRNQFGSDISKQMSQVTGLAPTIEVVEDELEDTKLMEIIECKICLCQLTVDSKPLQCERCLN